MGRIHIGDREGHVDTGRETEWDGPHEGRGREMTVVVVVVVWWGDHPYPVLSC